PISIQVGDLETSATGIGARERCGDGCKPDVANHAYVLKNVNRTCSATTSPAEKIRLAVAVQVGGGRRRYSVYRKIVLLVCVKGTAGNWSTGVNVPENTDTSLVRVIAKRKKHIRLAIAIKIVGTDFHITRSKRRVHVDPCCKRAGADRTWCTCIFIYRQLGAV